MRKHLLNMVFQFYFKITDSIITKHNIIHSSTFHATTYLFNLLSCYSDIIQSSKLDNHTNTLSLAHMDSFWFAKLLVALIRMMFMPYYVDVAVDVWKVAVFHTAIQHYFLTYNSEKRLTKEVLLQKNLEDYMLLKY